jgi:hypothetical protein
VQLLASWNIEPVAVIGHSSGEIAAAYAFGSLSFEDALTVAYFRGVYSNLVSEIAPQLRGAMLAVGLSEPEISVALSSIQASSGKAILLVLIARLASPFLATNLQLKSFRDCSIQDMYSTDDWLLTLLIILITWST